MFSQLRQASRVTLSGVQISRNISGSACLCGRKGRTPYDPRFPINPKDVSSNKTGGNDEFAREVVREDMHGRFPQLPGYYDKDGNFVLVKEMIPEFVVPDLTDFKLKPYVSYKVKEVKQSPLSSEDLFNACYAKGVVEAYKKGDLDVEKVLEKEKELQIASGKS